MEQHKKTWSCRLDEKQVAELRALIDGSGKTSAEFMEGVILIQKLSNVAEEAPMSAGYLQQLQTHTNGIMNCFGQLASGMQAVIDSAKADGNSRVAEVERQLTMERQRNKELAETIADQDTQIKQVSAQVTRAQQERDTARGRIKELEQNVKAYAELAEQSKMEAVDLKQQLNEARTASGAVKALEETVSKLRTELREAQAAHAAELADEKKRHQLEVAQLQTDFSDRLLKLGQASGPA